MAIGPVNTTAGNTGTGTAASLSPTVSGSAAVGDVGLLFITQNGTQAITAITTGWVQIAQVTTSGSNCRLTVYAKALVVGDPGSTLSVTFGGAQRAAWAVKTVGGAGGITVTALTQSNNTETNTLTVPSITARYQGSLWLGALSARNGTNGTTPTFTPPGGGFTENVDQTTNNAANPNIAQTVADVVVAAGATGTAVFTPSINCSYAGVSIIVDPAPVPAQSPPRRRPGGPAGTCRSRTTNTPAPVAPVPGTPRGRTQPGTRPPRSARHTDTPSAPPRSPGRDRRTARSPSPPARRGGARTTSAPPAPPATPTAPHRGTRPPSPPPRRARTTTTPPAVAPPVVVAPYVPPPRHARGDPTLWLRRHRTTTVPTPTAAPAPPAVDLVIEPLLDLVLACLCDALASHPTPPATCCHRVGATVTYTVQDCCPGMAWVRFAGATPVDDPDDDCGQPVTVWAVQVELGVARCAPAGPDVNPTCPQWQDTVTAGLLDWVALRRAACCVATDRRYMAVEITQMNTTGPAGGCQDVRMDLTVKVVGCDEC